MRSFEGLNWSGQLVDPSSANSLLGEALLDNLVLPGEISAVAVDPVQGYLAVGTLSGTVHIFGSPPVQISWPLSPSQPVKFLLFKPGTPLLICADSRENLSVYDLCRPDPAAQAKVHSQTARESRTRRPTYDSNLLHLHPDSPFRVAAFTARNAITALHLSSSHSHLFIGFRDGTVDTFDLDRLQTSPYRVPNCWYEEEELLRKSRVPDAPPRRHVPLVVDMAASPKDQNLLLLAYEGGVILLDIKQKSVAASFQLRLLPGAPGAGGIRPEAIWTERAIPAICVAWRPDAAVFAIGHEDGLISFWSPQDDSKPLLVRSLVELDLERPTVEELPARPLREPIFKMSWSGFPEKGWLDVLSGEKRAEDVSSVDAENNVTILTILGGAVTGHDPPGVALLYFASRVPSVLPAAATSSLWTFPSSPADQGSDAMQKSRQRLRSELSTIRESRLLTDSVVQDFVLLPRSSPHYGMAWDPVAIFMLVDIPHWLSPLAPPAAQRGLIAAIFPPQAPPGSSLSNLGATKALVPHGDERPGQASSGPIPATVSELISLKVCKLPFSLECTGAGAILDAQLINVSPRSYHKLVGSAGRGANEMVADVSCNRPSVPLRGGLAAAVTVGYQDTETLARVANSHRLLMTQHLDGTIRFADASPHLLLSPQRGCKDRPSASETQPKANGSGPQPLPLLDQAFPSPLPHLTICPSEILRHPLLVSQVTSAFDKQGSVRISSVHFAPEVLEATVVLQTGLLLQYNFWQAQFSQSEEVQADVWGETLRDLDNADSAAFSTLAQTHRAETHGSEPKSPINLGQSCEDFETGATLGADMQTALRELDLAESEEGQSSNCLPGNIAALRKHSFITRPPLTYPKRVPKRGSVFGRLGRERRLSVTASTTDSPTSPVPPPQLPMSSARCFDCSSDRDEATSYRAKEEFICLDHINDWSNDGFKAHLLINMERGEITRVAISDIGFLAFACGSGLALVDLHGPEILLREGMGNDFGVVVPKSNNKRFGKRSERKLLDAESKAPINSLSWTICRLPGSPNSSHAYLSPRLIVGRTNGLVTIWTLVHTGDVWLPEWTGASKIREHQAQDLSTPSGFKLLDVAGNEAAAVPIKLQRSIRETEQATGDEWMLNSDVPLLLGWSGSVLFLSVGILGRRLSKVDTAEGILSAALVDCHGGKLIITISITSIRIFAAPHLELIHRIQRHCHGRGDSKTNFRSVSIDASLSGTFLEVLSSVNVRLWTFFSHVPRPAQPSFLLWTPKPLPDHNSAGAIASVTSWFCGKAATASSLDDVLGGTNRPSARPKLPNKKIKETFLIAVTGKSIPPSDMEAFFASGETDEASDLVTDSVAPNAEGTLNPQPHSSTVVLTQSQEAQGTMRNNFDLAHRRGEAMQGLENSLASLEKSTNSWVKEAKAGLVKSAAKDRLSKFGL